MTATELVRAQVLRALEEADVPAMAAYSADKAVQPKGAVVAVDIRRLESGEAGFGAYLGERYDEERGTWQEEYGYTAQLTVALSAYASREAGAAACAAALEKSYDALMDCADDGFKSKSMEWGEVRWDKDSGLFLQQGTLRCGVYFIAAVEEEAFLLLDFKLKGALKE